MASLGSALVVVSAAGQASAQEPTTQVSLVAPSCPAEVIDVDALAGALRTALPSTLGTKTTVTPAPVDGATYRIDLACPGADTIDVTVTLPHGAPRAAEHDRISVAAVEPAARPGTVALALADRMGKLNARSVEPAPVRCAAKEAPAPRAANAPPSPPPATAPRELTEDAHERRVRLWRNLAIASAATTVAGVVIGAPLVAVGTESMPDTRPALTAGGGVLLGVAGAAFIMTGVSLGLWLHERHRRY